MAFGHSAVLIFSVLRSQISILISWEQCKTLQIPRENSIESADVLFTLGHSHLRRTQFDPNRAVKFVSCNTLKTLQIPVKSSEW